MTIATTYECTQRVLRRLLRLAALWLCVLSSLTFGGDPVQKPVKPDHVQIYGRYEIREFNLSVGDKFLLLRGGDLKIAEIKDGVVVLQRSKNLLRIKPEPGDYPFGNKEYLSFGKVDYEKGSVQIYLRSQVKYSWWDGLH